jgi:hypothetical protein
LPEIAPRRHNYFLIGDKIHRHFCLLVFVAISKSCAKFINLILRTLRLWWFLSSSSLGYL